MISLKKDVVGIIILLGAAAVTAFTVNHFSPVGIELLGQWDDSQGVVTAGAKDQVIDIGIELDDIEVVKRMYDSQETLFIDARSEDNYSDGHIKGALSLSLNRFDDLAGEFLEQYPLESSIVTYCSGRKCTDSHTIAQFLMELGYTNVRVFIDGFPAWKEKGYPIE